MDSWLPTPLPIVALIVLELRSDKSLSHFTSTIKVSSFEFGVWGFSSESLTRVIKLNSSSEYSLSFSFCTESFTNGCYSLLFNAERTSISCVAFHRVFSSFIKHLLTKSTKSDDHLDEESTGGSPYMILYITAPSSKPWYGFLRSASSIRVMPNAHISLFSPAPLLPFPEKTSGAQYSGVPAWAVLFDHEWFSWSDKPKSASWIKPLLDIRQFEGLISYAFIPLSSTHSVKHMLAMEIRQSKNETTRHFSQFSYR